MLWVCVCVWGGWVKVICCLLVCPVEDLCPFADLPTRLEATMLMFLATFRQEEGDQCLKLSLINNMTVIIGIFNCIVTYGIVKGKPPDTWKLFFNYW